MPLYYYLYTSISHTKEFNSIIINNINKKNLFINIHRFKTIKNIIFINFINKQTIKIAFNQTIIINFIILKLKTIIKYEKIKLFDLL